jgi:hypothetical protein
VTGSDADPSLREVAVAALANLTQSSDETQELLLRPVNDLTEYPAVRAASILALHDSKRSDDFEQRWTAFLDAFHLNWGHRSQVGQNRTLASFDWSMEMTSAFHASSKAWLSVLVARLWIGNVFYFKPV